MSYDLDEPEVLLGTNQGTNPVEYLLVALSGCITTTIVAYAAAKKIPLRGVESRFEGDIDLRGFLNISQEVPVGYQEIRVYFKIDADISDEQKEELIRLGRKIFTSSQYHQKSDTAFGAIGKIINLTEMSEANIFFRCKPPS